MSIVLARIDSRLVHGQVLEAWVPYVDADCIVVANDEVAAASFQCMVMQAAVPSSIDYWYTGGDRLYPKFCGASQKTCPLAFCHIRRCIKSS